NVRRNHAPGSDDRVGADRGTRKDHRSVAKEDAVPYANAADSRNPERPHGARVVSENMHIPRELDVVPNVDQPTVTWVYGKGVVKLRTVTDPEPSLYVPFQRPTAPQIDQGSLDTPPPQTH